MIEKAARVQFAYGGLRGLRGWVREVENGRAKVKWDDGSIEWVKIAYLQREEANSYARR